jgi:hypothetical protein
MVDKKRRMQKHMAGVDWPVGRREIMLKNTRKVKRMKFETIIERLWRSVRIGLLGSIGQNVLIEVDVWGAIFRDFCAYLFVVAF